MKIRVGRLLAWLSRELFMGGVRFKEGHRADIDCLRAIAILPVVFFHYGLSHPFNGGFAGVDVFFVISGFLIARHIHDEMEAGRFRILDFYNRRIRRILPVLVAVLLFCCICATLTEILPELENTRRGVIGSIFFISNIIFYRMSGYFDSASQSNPLLHTWSLSIEEQFYIFIPILFYVTKKYCRNRLNTALLFLLFLSFSLSCFEVYHDKPAAFYLVHNRAWELLLGAVVTLCGLPRVLRSQAAAETCGAVGIVLILGSVFILNKKSAFPGPGALAPCLGAALVLCSGVFYRTAVSSALSVRPLRFVGLISYSLYLWHWPIWVFFSSFYMPSLWTTGALLIVTCGVSVLSWRFIEQPFLAKPLRLSAPATIGVAGGFMMSITLLACLSIPLNAHIWHYTTAESHIMAYSLYKPTSMRIGTCFLDRKEDMKFFLSSHCLDVQTGRKNYLVLGDSHAADRWYGLHKVNPDINFLQATAPSCEPLMGNGKGICGEMLRYIFKDFMPSHTLDGVILSANWLDHNFGNAIATAQYLKKYATRVIILGPSPEYDQPLPLLLTRAMVKNNMKLVSGHELKNRLTRDTRLAILTRKAGIEYVSVYSILCPHETCLTTVANTVPLLFDTDHFTAVGSVFLASKMCLFGNKTACGIMEFDAPDQGDILK